ncbi:hypothetical protein [Actinomadura sp. J1-007]|nr:hypothetical protein [Actinomadura sp. J1-007]
MGAGTGRVATGAFMAVVGAGLGFTMQMTMTIAQNSVEMRDLGAASAAVTLFRTLGGSLAVAVFGALFSRSMPGSHLTAAGTAEGTRHIFLVAAALCAVAFVASLLVKEVPLRGKPTAPAAQEPAPTAPTASAS